MNTYHFTIIEKTRFTNGLTDTDVELWTEDGKISALGRQLAFIKETMDVINEKDMV